MKKSMLVVVVAMLVLSATAGFAADNVTVTIGVKAWSNSWDRKQTSSSGVTLADDDYGTSVMAGPALSLRLWKFFIAGSVMKSGENYVDPDKDTTTSTVVDYQLENERTDADAMMGIMFTPHIGIFVGYKSIEADTYEKSLLKSTGDEVGSVLVGTYTYKGPGVGVMGSIPLGSIFAIYGNITGMSLKYEHTYPNSPTVWKRDVTGVSGELGLALAMGRHVSATLGYKAQNFVGEDDASAGGLKVEDKFGGPTASFNLRF